MLTLISTVTYFELVLKLSIQKVPNTSDWGCLALKPHFSKRSQARDWLGVTPELSGPVVVAPR